ncbi:guanine nucleotide binding protein, alpha subunit [Collybia nuda]|uniref:Guanine nucleotide binding protein, alpha subunit n=1 Tax=Collybia nuda TaxID=64659 RepID=A0A9P6CC85_9AGAR|nr:guanine nucleotide binding protein, alpha subunit [Collybia nuda]
MKKSRVATAKATWPPLPPPDESEEARILRQKEEEEAKRVSDNIDKSIFAEKERKKRSPNAKILLLGQAESGKSTVLKNFQLHFSPKAFEAEADIWRPIIHLNLVRSVNFILNFLSATFGGMRDSTSHQYTHGGSLSSDVRRLCARLAPLRQVEESLTKGIAGSNLPGLSDTPSYNPAKASEVAIRSSAGWRAILKVRRQSEEALRGTGKLDDKDRRILAACGEDMATLWNDASVRKALKERDIALQEQPGFFLEDVDRIIREDYVPTPKDILCARVNTIGPEEHRINVEAATDNAKEWIIYDVGGSRSQRAAWAQYFDDVNVIIFLAPMSAFNQVLAEDESVNRLTDTFKLWQMICGNKLLAQVELILFLNKFDILAAKLKAGVQFGKYVQAYGSRPNELKAVSTFLVDIFTQIHKQNSPRRRKIHAHMTTAIDTKSTASIIDRIHEVIMVKILAHSNIL